MANMKDTATKNIGINKRSSMLEKSQSHVGGVSRMTLNADVPL